MRLHQRNIYELKINNRDSSSEKKKTKNKNQKAKQEKQLRQEHGQPMEDTEFVDIDASVIKSDKLITKQKCYSLWINY